MSMNSEPAKRAGKPDAFVQFIIEKCKDDKGVAAAFRRADNPSTEYQSWEYLTAFNIDLEKKWERIPYAAIAAAIARAKVEKNGVKGIGSAIACCYDDGNQSEQAKAKLRRLLACDSVEETCRILRPLFSLIDSKRVAGELNYAKLLYQLLHIGFDSQSVKTQWAMDFYRNTSNVVNEEGA